MIYSLPHALLAFLPVALAAPAPAPAPIALANPHYPLITPPPSLTDRHPSRVQERDVLSSVKSLASDATSDIAGLGTYLSSVIGTYPSYIASGVPNFFQDFPTGSAVESSLGISDSDLAATPTQVLNIPYVYISSYSLNSHTNQPSEVTQIGPTKVGTCVFVETSSSNPISRNPSSTIWQTSSSSAHQSSLSRPQSKPKHEI